MLARWGMLGAETVVRLPPDVSPARQRVRLLVVAAMKTEDEVMTTMRRFSKWNAGYNVGVRK